MGRLRFLLPVLFAILPVALVYAHNAGQLHMQQIVRPLVVSITFAVLSLALCFLWLRRSSTAAVLASLWVLVVLLFGHGVNLLEPLPGFSMTVARWVVATVGVLLLLLAGWLGRRASRAPGAWDAANRRLFFVALLLVLVQAGRIGSIELRSRLGTESLPSQAPEPAVATSTALPDIYFILLDGYGRTDVLREMYDFDNGEFVQQLSEWGFHVADRSYANYVGTLWSLASIFNMDYLHNLADVDKSLTHMNPLIRLIRSSRVVDGLRRQGYRIVSLASGYPAAEFGNPDDYHKMPHALNDFEQLLIAMTPLPWVWKQRTDAYEMHRKRLRWIFAQIPQLPDIPQPRLVFAHILAPHPPFVLDRNGAATQEAKTFAMNDGSDYYRLGGTPEEYCRLYAEQAHWVSQQVEALVQTLLQDKSSLPAIVLLSDHGPGSQLNWDSVSETNLWERFAVLNALYLPGLEDMRLPRDLSPAGTFRLLFDLYLGTNLGPLPAKSYFASTAHPFDFTDVTDQLP